MPSTQQSRFIKQYGWLIAISSILLISLIVMSQILQNASQFAQTYSTLLFISFGGMIVLIVMLVRAFLKIRKQYKANTPGLKLTVRLTTIIGFMLGIPLAIIFYFSMSFVHQGINQWFDVKTEEALENAVKLVQITLDDQTRRNLNNTQQALNLYRDELFITPVLTLNKLGEQLNTREIALYKSDGQLIAYSSQDNVNILPKSPAPRLFQQVRKKLTYAAIETQSGLNTSYQIIRIMLPVTDVKNNKLYALQAVFSIPEQLSHLADTVRISAGQYQELSYLKGPLKTSFTVILSMVLLLTIISTLLFTIKTIQNITRPIRTLARGTKAVAKGDYTISMPVVQEDEMGQLIHSFNDMIQQIAKARNDIKFGHQQTEMQKLYLQAIIKNLNSGVLTLDMNLRLKTINDATNSILNTDLFKQLGKPLNEILKQPESQHLKQFFDTIFPLFRNDAKPWSEQLTFDCKEGQKILLVHGSTLPSLDQKAGGFVIVIEDITQLVQAQLHAAWSDVAQRLAHEIKNPLTPIQLSAERLNYKLADKLTTTDQQLLNRMTDTIIEQVAAMQNLVQAFTEYADTPEIELSQLNLNVLIKDVVSMYKDPKANWKVSYKVDVQCPKITADASKLRQLLHNLIKNAIEACGERPNTRIDVQTNCAHDEIEFSICDNGPGIPEKARNWIFEPYSTDKPKGTGLGLAIVKKIVDEHQGQIHVESEPEQGTCFIINLPQHTKR
ncbi:ATP-binding protein [Hydrogenovibrio sp. 3SP14C1]|uniref:sensor histidine kinase n=1 Tax=Hydrogenovibrio sp. 3SP14C1 TaxID=3038774 RepID=UPI002415E114|nr:ATP-binding protein [Hydrogenovibrio sp. 3SP14C1]MDG4813238.1 ATP-binding protein [Hydrogenovibrio sp. 3SP14C1]